MSNKQKIEAVDVYLEKRKTREYVGQLSREAGYYIFTYDNKYLYKDRTLAIGPDLPLSKKKFRSRTLFPSFEDRIPSKRNPAYQEYCQMVGIDPNETDLLTLVATLGQKGPSSFVFSPAVTVTLTNETLISFRKDLNLTIREFSELFDFSPATITRMENKKINGKDTLKRLEIYCNFSNAALYEARKNRHKINDEKFKHVEEFLQFKNNSKV